MRAGGVMRRCRGAYPRGKNVRREPQCAPMPQRDGPVGWGPLCGRHRRAAPPSSTTTMRDHTEQSEGEIDSWLAGALPPAQRDRLERRLAAPELEIDPELLRDLDLERRTADPILSELIETLKFAPLDGGPPDPGSDSGRETWRDILEPVEGEALLGALGGYQIVELIAAGGMGIVFKAHDPDLQREVAIKVLAPELAARSGARERFLREARAAARLEHENILPIYGVHEVEGVPYFAMRLATGGSLQDALDRGEPFGLARLKVIAAGVANALGAAHEAGIVHRDIKPANILFDADDPGRVWVCDFGIAWSADDPDLTLAGALAGTPHYMSPEQAEGGVLDGRSDLFSLGAVLYRCAAGGQAFGGTTSASVLRSVSRCDPDLSAVELPRWFSNLIGQLLAKRPGDRPDDGGAVAAAIAGERSPPPRGRRPRLRRFAVAGVAGSLALTGVASLPGTKRAVNAHLARDLPHAYTVEGRYGVYATLGEAVAAARDGDTIALPEGPTEIGGLEIPAGKALTLTAAETGGRSIIATQPGAPGIDARAPLSLSGIDFELWSGPGMPAAIRLGAGGGFADCRFRCTGAGAHRPSETDPCAIELRGGGQIALEDCEFHPSIAVPLRVETGSPTVRSSRCQAAASYFIHVPEHARPESVSAVLSGCDIAAANLVRDDGAGVTRIEVDARDSTIAVASRVAQIASENPREAREQFRWVGAGNRYPFAGNEAKFTAGRASAAGDEVVRIDPRPGLIHIEGQGATFTDLAAALESAADGATLLLEGEFECREEILTERGKTLHLRAAEGGRPLVFTRDPRDHAIRFRGPTTLAGIRFHRFAASPRSMPIVAIEPGGGGSTVEDCEFISAAGEFGVVAHRGLGVRDCRAMTVRRCHFRVPGGCALLVGPGTGEVEIEECLFFSLAAIESGGDVAEERRRFLLSRSVLYCGVAVTNDPFRGFPPLRMGLRGNLVHLMRGGFYLADIPPAELSGLIEWESVDNTYRGNTFFLQTYRARAPASFKPTLVVSEAQQAKLFDRPEARRDFGTRFLSRPFFDFERPLYLVGAEDLLGSLNPAVSEALPAVATLERFGGGTAGE